MDTEQAARAVEEFKVLMPLYESFGRSVCSILSEALQSLLIHSIALRVKDPEHLREKLTRIGKDYGQLNEVTDLLGVRVITYFEDTVDQVVDVLDREFDIDHDRSVDKRQGLDPERFGYLSVHKICRHLESRIRLTEYRKFGGLCCEIQVRSILQHAWSEMEHDLGYKSRGSVPVPVRRRFSMLAGLFELADQEFVRLRDELAEYAIKVTQDIETQPEAVLLDAVSLGSFLNSSRRCSELDQLACEMVGARLEKASSESNERRTVELRYVDIGNIKQLGSALEENDSRIRRKIQELQGLTYASLEQGISLFYLVQILLGRRTTIEAVEQGLEDLSIGPRLQQRQELARQLYQIARS